MSSRSLPASMARTAASPAGHCIAGSMLSASVTTTPVKPELAAEQVDQHLAGEARRQARVDRLHVQVPGHDHVGAGVDAGLERRQVGGDERVPALRQHRQRVVAVDGGVAVARESA